MAAILHLTDVYVSKGYENAPQAKFTPNKGNEKYGTLNFRVSNKRSVRGQDGQYSNVYDSYSVQWRGVSAESKVIGLINTESVRVSLFGELSNEEFNNNKFLRVSCEGRQGVQIASLPRQEESAAPAAPASAPAGQPAF